MWKCEECGRHVLPVIKACPFCTTVRVASWSTAIVTPIVLSACYGAPPCAEDQVTDQDNDGFVVPLPEQFCDPRGPIDCDDGNAAINPDAEEICGDGIDNNCDGIEASPEQTEYCNGLDDDCDGLIDEDNACGTDTGVTDTASPPADAAIALTLDWGKGFGSCEAAGVQSLTVSLREQPDAEPVDSRTVDCEDDVVAVLDLPVGPWLVDAVATSTDGVRDWRSDTRVVGLDSDLTLPVTLTLTCSSTEPDGCTP